MSEKKAEALKDFLERVDETKLGHVFDADDRIISMMDTIGIVLNSDYLLNLKEKGFSEFKIGYVLGVLKSKVGGKEKW